MIGVIVLLFSVIIIIEYICKKNKLSISPSICLNFVATKLKQFFTLLGKYILNLVSYITFYFVWKWILDNYKYLLQQLINLVNNLVKFIIELYEKWWCRLVRVVQKLFNIVRDFCTELYSTIYDIVNPIFKIAVSPLYTFYGYFKQLSNLKYGELFIDITCLLMVSPFIIDSFFFNGDYFVSGYFYNILTWIGNNFGQTDDEYVNIDYETDQFKIIFVIFVIIFMITCIWTNKRIKYYYDEKIGVTIVLVTALFTIPILNTMCNIVNMDNHMCKQSMCYAYNL
jgi:hypothetical protein